MYINHRPAFGLNPADLYHAFSTLSNQVNSENGQPQMYRENLLYLLQQYGEHMNDYEMADCLSNLLHLSNESIEMFDTMNAEDACMLIQLTFLPLDEDKIYFLGQFIENQLPEHVTIQTLMEDLLKMPAQYIDLVIYTMKEQQQRDGASLLLSKERRGQLPIEQQQPKQQQRHRSAITPTTQSTASASNDSEIP